jgi:hypothetical protein
MIVEEQLRQAEELAQRQLEARFRSTDLVIQLASCILVLVRELRRVKAIIGDKT